MQCNICGKEEAEYVSEIEGTEMKVCHACSGYGKNTKKIKKEQPIARKKYVPYKAEKEKPIELIVDNYAEIIKNTREKRGLKQEELAKKINEKESVIHGLESRQREPRIELARKLEKFLDIDLVEIRMEKDLHLKTQVTPNTSLTLGDMIKIKHRKK